MNFLRQMLRDDMEYHNGRLHFSTGHWRFVGSKEGKFRADGFKRQSTCRSTGKEMEFVILRSVACPNPEMDGKWPNVADPPKGPKYSVPASVCAKCPHHGKRGEKGMKYPFCKWAQAERGGTKGAVADFFGTLNKATQEVHEMMHPSPGKPKPEAES